MDCTGTVFFYCGAKDERRHGFFAQLAAAANRQLFNLEDCRRVAPEALAKLPGKKAMFVQPSMMEFLDRYLEACPIEERHRLICSPRYGKPPHMSIPFHDFWEERGVEIEELSSVLPLGGK